MSPLFFLKKLATFFGRHCHFYCFHSGVTPCRVSTHTFVYLSDLVCPLFFVNSATIFFRSGVTPPGGCHPRRSNPRLYCSFLSPLFLPSPFPFLPFHFPPFPFPLSCPIPFAVFSSSSGSRRSPVARSTLNQDVVIVYGPQTTAENATVQGILW